MNRFVGEPQDHDDSLEAHYRQEIAVGETMLDKLREALRESQAENAKLREALESCAGVIDTDFIKSETEDGEVEYWINDQTIQHIVEEALKETKP